MNTGVIDTELVDLDRLADWMDAQDLPRGPIENAERLAGGTQNVLLRFERGGETYVLRRPPPHPRKNSNETMRREARVLAALAGSNVPHPHLLAACPDTDVLGVAFYLMEPIDGFNPSTGLPEPHRSDAAIRHAMGLELVDGIVRLGRVDYLSVGLDGFGKPEGFLERQVDRWRSLLESYGELEGYPGPEIGNVDEVASWLEANRPTTWQPGILHGDYHLANVMFANDGPRLAAIVDWELCTIGDPLLDLGWLLATWPNEETADVSIGVTSGDGFPLPEELVERYRAGSSRDLSAINWYAVLACYKLGIILEGTHARAFAGKADKNTGDLLHATTVGLFARAEKFIANS
jgi:aminoglycoside phosphotransferase (APT) family kinase protein